MEEIKRNDKGTYSLVLDKSVSLVESSKFKVDISHVTASSSVGLESLGPLRHLRIRNNCAFKVQQNHDILKLKGRNKEKRQGTYSLVLSHGFSYSQFPPIFL